MLELKKMFQSLYTWCNSLPISNFMCTRVVCPSMLLMNLDYLSKLLVYSLTFTLVCFPLFIGIQWHVVDHLPSHVHQLLKVRWHSDTAFASFSCSFDEKNRVVCINLFGVIIEEKLNTGSPVGLNWIGLKTNQARAVVKTFGWMGQWQLSCFKIKRSRKWLQSIRTYDKLFHLKSSTHIL